MSIICGGIWVKTQNVAGWSVLFASTRERQAGNGKICVPRLPFLRRNAIL